MKARPRFPEGRAFVVSTEDVMPLLRSRRGSARSELWQRRDRVTGYRPAWRAACEGAGLVHCVDVAAGTTICIPELVDVTGGPEPVLTVKLLSGQLAEDVANVAHRLAPALGAPRALVEPLGLMHVRLHLVMADPLADPFHTALDPVTTATRQLVLGLDEQGATIAHALAEPAHLLCQGQNGSGKSRFTYGLLSQCAHAPDVLVTGSDITGLLLGAPWDGTRHREHQAAGTADLAAHADQLEQLVAEMDRRLSAMPRGVDKLDPTPATPLLLVVLEEFPGLLRAAAALGKPERGQRSVLDRIKGATLRLLSEGRKVAVRVLMLAQRAEADATGGGYAREQFALVVSFRVPADSLVMGHGDDARELGASHRTAAPGIAVVSAPGRPLTRMRAPHYGNYGQYVDAVGPQLDRSPSLRLVAG